VWPGAEAVVAPLGGGITNRNFRVDVGGESFVLRIGGKNTELLGIDRAAEHAASLSAARLGVGPEVLAFVEPEGYLVTRYVEGEVGRLDPVRAGALLRRVHDGPPIPSRFDAFRVVEAYAATATAHGVPLPGEFADAAAVATKIERRLGARPLVPCHNDLLSANFIDDGERLWLVDWEYAGMGDPAFDLANFAVNNDLDDVAERAMLERYGTNDGGVRSRHEISDGGVLSHNRAIVLMRFISDFREAMWGVVQQAISELDFDFHGYAERHFERLTRAAAEPRFARALGS
jgi:thiamine kinase-like enzyme